MRPDRTKLAGLSIPRILTGLWQVADQEKEGTPVDVTACAAALTDYARAGFDAFDMADHYGSAELIAGVALRGWDGGGQRPLAFTKWCPAPGPMTPEVVRAGVQERLDRLGVERVDLLQFHWWSFEHPGWLDALHGIEALRREGLVNAIGVTNFDAAHLAVALSDGIPIVSNQVSFSLLDRRAEGPLSALCLARGVRLLAYGTLCGGLLSKRWLGAPRPEAVADWSKMKYLRFVDAAGGWDAFQSLLQAADRVARRHNVTLSNVATCWALEHEAVAATIVGARLGEGEHRADNLAPFGFALNDEDRAILAEGFAATRPIPGDCGDEYRVPPFLTASGDLSHHLSEMPSVMTLVPDPERAGRARVFSGSEWEPIAGYCRAVRDGNRILVSGTTATHGLDRVVAPSDAGAQTTYILDKIAAAVRALGGRPEDILRTRLYLREGSDVEAAARAHGRHFAASTPANTTFVVGNLIGDFRVEIEAEAVLI